MIELNDPYWRRLVARSGALVLALALLAFVAFPTAESGHGGSPSAGAGHGLALSELKWDYFQDQDHARVWVDVRNPGDLDAVNLTATLAGIEPSPDHPAQSDAYNGNLPRGGSTTFKFSVYAGTSATLTATITTLAPLASLSLEVTSPSGDSFSGQAAGSGATVSLSADEVAAGADAEWSAHLALSGGFRGVGYSFVVESTPAATSATLTLDTLPPGETHEFAWVVLASPPPQVLPANLSATVSGTVSEGAGRTADVAYSSTFESGGTSIPLPGGEGGTEALLTAGEFLGFSAIGLLGLSVASGALRARGGRTNSQNRASPEVSLHRLVWLAVLLVLLFHGLAQLVGGHLYLAAAVVGTAAVGTLAALIWFNAYNRKRVLAMAWPRWLRLKLLWVAVALSFIAAHLLLFGRHFVG